MSTRDAGRRLLLLLAVSLAVLACEQGREPPLPAPGLGEPVTASDLAALEGMIPPEGTGLPAGAGSALQGRALYERSCLVCHGVGGRGGPAGDLVGGQGSLGGPTPKRTVGSYWPYATTLFDYIRRAMPYDRPGSLTSSEVYALVAYLLAENQIVEADAVMDAKTLPAVMMPNRGGFPTASP